MFHIPIPESLQDPTVIKFYTGAMSVNLKLYGILDAVPGNGYVPRGDPDALLTMGSRYTILRDALRMQEKALERQVS